MSRRPLSVDPPDLGLWPTAKGLARLWREQRQLVALGLACALVYSGLALAIPIVIRHAIDNAIAPKSGHRAAIWPYLVAVLGLAILRFHREAYDVLWAAFKREILEICHDSLASYKIPATIRFVHSLEIADAGKLARHA